MANRKAHLNLEGLTDRVVPAVSGISFLNGSLSVRLDNQGGTLTVLGGSATNASNFQLKYNGNSVGNASGYNVTNAITIMGGNGKDTVEFDAQPGQTTYRIPGNLTINLGNGDDIITTANKFTVNGSANINTGNGGDDITINTGTAAATVAVNGSLTVNFGGGDDSITTGAGSFTVNGFTTINGGNEINFSTGTNLFNSVTLNSSFGETIGNSVDLGDTTTIRGNLVFIGGSFVDTVGIDGSSILGNATLNLGQGAGPPAGNQIVTLSSTAATTINGNLTVLSGNGVDEIIFDTGADTVVGGNVTLNLGNGNNNISLDGNGAGSIIGGSLTILTGTGDDTVTIGASGTFSINGSVSISLGNSNNGNNTTITTTLIGGNLSYTGGTGSDTVEFDTGDSVVSGRVSANMGGGQDTFTIAAGATSFGALYLDFGVGSGPDAFNNASTANFDIFIYNFTTP